MPNEIYPRNLGDKQTFREDFINTSTVVENGGGIVSSPVIKNYYQSDGSSYVEYDSSRLGIYQSITIEFEIDNISSAPSNYEGWITAYTASDGFDIGADANNIYIVFRGAGGGTKTQAHSGLGLFDGEKHQLVVTNDGSNTNLYVDGAVVGSATASGVGQLPTATLKIGDRSGAEPMESGNRISHCRIYQNTAWTAEEASDAYANSTYHEIDASKAVVWLPLRSRFAGVTGSTLLTDGDMEAVGTDSWSASLGASLSKTTTNPKQGTQALRVEDTDGGIAIAVQTVLTQFKTYRATGWARGDGGSGTPRVYIGTASSHHWEGTSSTDWQYFDITITANNTFFALGGIATVDFDNVVLKEVNQQTENKGTGANAIVGDGVTASTYPTFLNPHGANFDTTDYLKLPVATNSVSGEEKVTMACLVKPDAFTNNYARFFEQADDTTDRVLFSTGGPGIGSTSRLACFVGSGYGSTNVDNLFVGNYCTAIFVYDGSQSTNATRAKIYWNGELQTLNFVNTIPATIPTIADDMYIGISNVTASRAWDGDMFFPAVYKESLTPRQVRNLHLKMFKELNN